MMEKSEYWKMQIPVEHEKIRTNKPTVPGIKLQEKTIAETIGEVKMKALIAYAELLIKKHPTWTKEKVAKKSAGLYNIKLV